MGSLLKCKQNLSLLNDIPPHEPLTQAISNPVPRIRVWSISSSVRAILRGFIGHQYVYCLLDLVMIAQGFSRVLVTMPVWPPTWRNYTMFYT